MIKELTIKEGRGKVSQVCLKACGFCVFLQIIFLHASIFTLHTVCKFTEKASSVIADMVPNVKLIRNISHQFANLIS